MRPQAARLRRRLMLLATVAIVPMAIACGLALGALLRQQAGQTRQTAQDLARALATAVDNELRLSISALQALALTGPMGATESDGLAQAHRLARDTLESRPEWLAVLLLRPDGRAVFSTGTPFGGEVPVAVETASIAELVATGRPTVGSVTTGPAGRFGIAVRVPVVREGRLLYVLTAVLRPEAARSVVTRQQIPPDWIVSVFDGRRMRVARSRDHERFIAQPAPAEVGALIEAAAATGQAYGETSTLEGERVRTAVSRVPLGGWSVALGLPTERSGWAFWASVGAYGGGILLSVLVAALAAWRVSRGIERPIERLRQAALAFGRDERIADAPSGIVELDTMSHTLATASGERARHAAERESLLAAERAARAAAEQAQRRTGLLVQAGARLSQPLDENGTLEAIAQLIVPDLADACRIDLLDAQGVLQRRITHHVDPQRRRAIETFVARHVAPPDTPGTFPWAIKTGQTFLATFPDPEHGPFEHPDMREFARLVGIRSLFVAPLIARGQTLGAMAVMQAESGRALDVEDGRLVTELAQRAALALDNVRLLADARSALDAASVANRAKDDFMAMLGHELRNPLAPIVAALELMARRDPEGLMHERIVIERQVRHLARLVDDLLDVSRIASGKVDLRRERVELHGVVQRALELSEPAMAGRTPPRLHLAEDPVWVEGDAMRLAQVVSNLLVNAAKFSAPQQSIDVELRCEADRAALVVRDEGIGIAPELLPRVFDRFVQGDQALHRERGGLGLGLSIARNLVELHGGSIEAHSNGPGQGARFTVRLPLARAATASAPAQHAPPVASPAVAPRRVLIVDDNVDAAQTLGELLALEGHEVRTAASAAQALQVVPAFEPEVAILDIGLPQMDGYQLAAALRAQPRGQAMRLIALTGFGQASDRDRAGEAGFDAHLVKPVDVDVLLATLMPRAQTRSPA